MYEFISKVFTILCQESTAFLEKVIIFYQKFVIYCNNINCAILYFIVGWRDFLRKIFNTCQVVPNCFRIKILKFRFLLLLFTLLQGLGKMLTGALTVKSATTKNLFLNFFKRQNKLRDQVKKPCAQIGGLNKFVCKFSKKVYIFKVSLI